MRSAAHRRDAPVAAAILVALACSACTFLQQRPAEPTASRPPETTRSPAPGPTPAAIPPTAAVPRAVSPAVPPAVPAAAPAGPAQKAPAAPAQKPPTAKPAAPAAPKPSPAPGATPPAAVAKAAPAPLDLKSLEQRLKETNAIGVMTKLSLKNQVDDLLDRFRDYYAGRLNTTLAELRPAFDLLVMKVLSLLQDSDTALAKAIHDSREAIWAILSNRERFAQYA